MLYLNGRNIKRVVATGCSFAYGHGLADRTVESWPARLASKLNVEHVNLGIQAMGNDHVYGSIVDYFSENPDDKKDSFVVPSFSSYTRVEFYSKQLNNRHTGLWPETWCTRPGNNNIRHSDFNDLFYTEYFDEEYYFARYYKSIIALQSVLKCWMIPHVMFDGLDNPHGFYNNKKRIQILKKQVDEKNWIKFGKECFHGMTGLKKLPCGHPTAEAHDEMADILYQHIINNYAMEQI